MKKKLFYAILATGIGLTSCDNNHKAVNTTTNSDTAVLVNDPGNSLNASPVKDTMVQDTVHNHQ